MWLASSGHLRRSAGWWVEVPEALVYWGQMGPFWNRDKWFCLFEIDVDNGFVWQFFTEGLESVELLDGAAVVRAGGRSGIRGIGGAALGGNGEMGFWHWDTGLRFEM